MHTALIKRIAVDKAGRYLVTGSLDKTVRVWDAKTGALLRTLRPPIGEGNEGKIYAVAITPDGKTIVCGGFTTPDGAKDTPLYVFDRASGALLRRVTGLPDVTSSLAVSPDGTRVAATLGGKNGVRVFRVADGSPAGSDADYGNDSYGVDFDPAGSHLVTACDDGFVRRYAVGGAAGLRLLAKVKAPGGAQPFSVRYSPDGARVAVCYYDTAAVSVLAADDLSLRFAPDTAGVKRGYLSSVCWGADGAALFVGGSVRDADDKCFVRRWAGGGKGAFTDTPVADNTLFDLRAVGSTLFYASGEPTLGALDAASLTRRWRDAPQTLNPNGTTLGLDADGTTAQFNYANGAFIDATKQVRFDIGRRELVVRAADNEKVFALGDLTKSPKTEADGMSITDWENDEHPKINGVAIPLDQNEMSRSLAIAPAGDAFLLGTGFYVRCFGRDGTQRWKVALPGDAWGVNVSGDGDVLAAAFGDGTIRWYRMTDGKELCALFVHADLKRWVLWTPSGYYDCSPGGEDLIGWHVNRGANHEADFFSAGQFRDTFYRPDVLAQVLKTRDEREALRLADAARGHATTVANADTVAHKLPPVLTAAPDAAPVFAPTRVTLHFAVRAPSDAPVILLLAFVDGRPVPLALAPTATEAAIPVEAGNQVVSMIAVNANGASQPLVVPLPAAKGMAGNAAPAEQPFRAKPKLYVLAVGVNRYAQAERNLHYAASDASGFAAVLKAQSGGLYESVTVKTLTDEQATRARVTKGLDWIRRETTARDVAMILFSGHGANNPDGDFYFLTHDFDGADWDNTALSFDVIKRNIPRIAGKVLFFIDACHSGDVLGASRDKGDPPDIVRVVNELSEARNGVIVFTASTGTQVALEDGKWGHGAFTKAILEGIGGEADYRKTGRITVKMLDLYVSERVKALTSGAQTPTTPRIDAVLDFPVAVKR